MFRTPSAIQRLLSGTCIQRTEPDPDRKRTRPNGHVFPLLFLLEAGLKEGSKSLLDNALT